MSRNIKGLLMVLICMVAMFLLYACGVKDGYNKRDEEIESAVIRHWTEKYGSPYKEPFKTDYAGRRSNK